MKMEDESPVNAGKGRGVSREERVAVKVALYSGGYLLALFVEYQWIGERRGWVNNGYVFFVYLLVIPLVLVAYSLGFALLMALGSFLYECIRTTGLSGNMVFVRRFRLYPASRVGKITAEPHHQLL